MKKSVVLTSHLSFWVSMAVSFCVVIALLSQDSGRKLELPLLFFILEAFVGCVLIFYIFYFSAPFFLKKKKRLCFLFTSIFTLAVIYGFIAKYRLNNSSYLIEVIALFAPVLIFAIIAILVRVVTNLWKDSLAKSELEKEKVFTQIELLKAKLNPHFLFNSLNNIDILIEENPKTASDYLTKLSDILRYVLYEAKDDDILLARELEQIESYIELQKIRTENTRFVNFSIRGELNRPRIAPMIFIPFIENAFKYCKNKSVDNAINIAFDIQSDTVKMTCKNYYDSTHLEIIKNNDGLGIDIMKQRLNLLYPECHELIIDKSEQWFSVVISIKLKNGD